MAVTQGTVEVVMPAMGDSVTEGTVLEWRKNVGDHVDADETIVEISTDKVDAEVPAPIAGTVTKVNFAEGDTVVVGAVLAEISMGDAPAPPNGDGASGEPVAADPPGAVSTESPPATPEEAVAAAAIEAEHAAGSDGAAGRTVEIVTPTGGESVTEGTILEWSSRSARPSSRATRWSRSPRTRWTWSSPRPASGTITEILAQDGETVTVGQVIGRMSTSPVGAAAGAAAGAAGAAPPEADEKAAIIQEKSTPSSRVPASAATAADVDASPVARRIAAQEGIDLAAVQGSARAGRITKADVLAAASGGNGAGAASTATPAPPRRAPAPGAGSTLLKGARRPWPGTWTRAGRCPRPPRSGRSR